MDSVVTPLHSNGQAYMELNRWRRRNWRAILAKLFQLLYTNRHPNNRNDRKLPNRQGGTPPPSKSSAGAYEKVFLGIAITITAVWALGTLIQIVYPDHAVPQTVNYVMIAVAGCFFGGSLVTRNGGRK